MKYQLFVPKTILKAITLFLLILNATQSGAQERPSSEEQWKSVGGQIVASGTNDFTNMWYSAWRYGAAPDGLFWLNDENKEKTATHTTEEVTKDVMINKGHITVKGPGFLAKFLRTKKGSVGAKLVSVETGKNFITAPLGEQRLLKESDGEWHWSDYHISEFDPTIDQQFGWIPDGKVMTFDVWAYNNYTDWGIWGRGFAAPKGVEYEFWFFPREGGKVISASASGFEKPQPGIIYYTDKDCN